MQYRKAEIHPKNLDPAVEKWYVYYFFMNPFDGKFERFKVYEDVNRYKGAERVRYAEDLRDAVNAMLRNGYNPWDEERKLKAKLDEQEKRAKAAASGDKSQFTIIQALNYFLKETEASGVAKATLGRYKTHVNGFKDWLNNEYMLLVTAATITPGHVFDFLNGANEKNKWTNKTYNNYLGSLQAAFNLLAKKIHNVIPHNPIQGAATKSTLATKHTAYTDQQLAWLLSAVRKAKDVYMEGIISTVYYSCVRSKAELLGLKAGNVLYDRNLLRLDAENTKGKRDDFVPLDPVLKAFYLSQGFDKLPADWYLFGHNGKPDPKPAYRNYYADLFRPYRDALNLSDKYTLYGFKHTRCIHLVLAKVSRAAIMQLTRHQTEGQLMAYLRDLGCLVDFEAVENSREI